MAELKDCQQWVRNEIIFGIGASVIGWVLGLTLMRQAARHEAMMDANLDEYQRKRDSEDTWTCVVCESNTFQSKPLSPVVVP